MFLRFLFSLILPILAVSVLGAQNDARWADSLRTASPWSIHGQQTIVGQYHIPFHAAYSGPHSHLTDDKTRYTITSTLFLGRRLWRGAEAYFNPELSGGSGLGEALGIAGFLNGEAFRVGSPTPVVYVARAFLRQQFLLGKEWSLAGSDAMNSLRRMEALPRLVFSVGKFGLADYFDANRYSHDPRSQFWNWSLMSAGAWDYAANTRGYTYGFIAEYLSGRFELRYGISQVPKTANGNVLDPHLYRSNAQMLEAKLPFKLRGRPGALRVLGFLNQAHMGNYLQAYSQPDTPNVAATRRFGRTKYGFLLNLEQELSGHLGLFARASWNDGRNETWAFTEIDQSLCVGLSSDGSRWGRPQDVFGIGAVANGISKWHRTYLARGGLGFILGDGRLTYAPESILELYYAFAVNHWLTLTPDYQFVLNPGYNRDRGPIHAVGLRMHTQF